MSWSERERGLEQAAEELREKLGRFACRPRFGDELEDAFEFYFGYGIGEFDARPGEAEFQRFMEWFIHDYRLSHGHRLIEVFDLEHGADLSVVERELLLGWMDAHLTLLEVVGETGGAWACVDLLTGRRFETVRFRGEPPLRWSIVVGRPLPVGKSHEISDAAVRLAPAVKEIFLEHLRGEYRRFRFERRGAPVKEFLRDNSYCFNDLLTELDEWIAAANAQDEQVHRIVSARAVYTVRDPEQVAARLLAYDDTVQVRPGRFVVRDRNGDRTRMLAEIRLTDRRMHVRCWSPERLEESKRQLAHRLAGLVRHSLDAYEERSLLPISPPASPAPLAREGTAAPRRGCGAPCGAGEGVEGGAKEGAGRRGGRASVVWQENGWPDERASGAGVQELGERVSEEEFVERWLERPHPGLNGQPPKRLATLPLGRLRVAELLKRMEYQERRRPSAPRAVCELRRRLGLRDEDGIVFPLDALPDRWNRKAEEAVLDALLRVGMRELGPEHLSSAAWIWWNYCSLAFPVIRKPNVWAAALHYCVGFVENWQLRRDELAARYGASTAAVSQNSWKIVDVLYLQPYDDRYSVFSPLSGLFRRLGLLVAGEVQDAEDPYLAASLSKAARLREAIARAAEGSGPALRERAYAFFASHVGARQAAEWEEMFLDWYHFDWRVPVMGGRTFVEEAFLYSDLSENETSALMGWIGRHPSFYVVEAVEGDVSAPAVGREAPARGWGRGRRVSLLGMMDQKPIDVDWLRLSQPISPGDILFARLVPVDGLVISIGPVLTFPARCREVIRGALAEDRALVERWNGRTLSWYEFGALYAERLYALALRGVGDSGINLYED